MSALEAAKEFLAKAKDMAQDDRKEALAKLPEEVQEAYYDLQKASYFVPENADLEHREERLSSSGKYKLVVTPFNTGPGSWNFTQGLVYAIGSDTPIAEVRRNYHGFPLLFVEGHPNGHDYLVCGEDYQGQTVIELDTGRRRDFLPKEAAKGHGFCWVDFRYNAETQMLLVDGCYWAAPYEYRFYDFSDPMSGWPQIGEGVWIDADSRQPELRPDGTIKVFQSLTEPDEDEDSPNMDKIVGVAAYTIYRREGLKLVEIEAWVSEQEQERRRRQQEAERKYEEWYANFKATDPLYLTVIETLKDPVFNPADYNSIGITYDKWCPDFTKRERRMCRRIADRKVGVTLDLEWATETGPIKLIIYRDGKHVGAKFYEHSVEAMKEALAYGKELLS